MQTLTGTQALAHAAVEAGVRVVASYPGSPGSATVQALLELTQLDDLYVEWSTNEKVALEVGIGASLAGSRALVCVKSVGMNALVDPLMVLNLTGVGGGLIILLGDDPGAYGSQNDQDTRPLAAFAEMPLLEPATPAEARAMILEGLDLSERLGTAVIVRHTRSFSQAPGPVEVGSARPPQMLPMRREPMRYVSTPTNSVEKHHALHARLDQISEWADQSPFNKISGGGRKGVLAAGFAYAKLLDVLGEGRDDLRLLKLGTLYPLPERVIATFLLGCDEVLVLEENEPIVEMGVKAIAHDAGLPTRVLGKRTAHVPLEGELFRWHIQAGLARFVEGFVPARAYAESGEAGERPTKKDPCAGCPFEKIVTALKDAGAELGQDPVLVADPGCLVRAAHLMDAKYAMGSSIAVAQGMVRAGLEERAVALFGDSSFFHTTLPALVNVVYNRTPVLMVVLDNAATLASGAQPNPATGMDARGRPAPALSIEDIARACGVESVRTVAFDDGDETLRAAFRQGLETDAPALLIVRVPCDRPD